jgi:hypothetical protein
MFEVSLARYSRLMKKLILPVLMMGFLTACNDSKGRAPGAETSVSVNLDETKETAKKTFKNAEREIEKGAAKAKDKLEDAGEALSDKLAEAKDKLTDNDKPSVKVEVKKE